MPTNFLLASSAVIPILALTALVELRTYQPPPNVPLLVVAVLFVPGFLLEAFVIGSGEWVCLRSLELGHVGQPPTGGSSTGFVWLTMINLAVLVGIALAVAILLPVIGEAMVRRAERSSAQTRG